jgi:hypothetical protein
VRPRIFNGKAAKQAFYREALAAGFDKEHGGMKAYREALAAGLVTPPLSYELAKDMGEYVNQGWYGQPPSHTPRKPKATHVASTNPIRDRMTLCGKFQEDVTLVATPEEATCGRCRNIKVTPPVRKHGHEDGCRCARRKPRIYHEDKQYLADVKAAEEEYNARRQNEMEAATDRCGHGIRNDDIEQDCLICFPVDDEPTVTPPEPRRLARQKHGILTEAELRRKEKVTPPEDPMRSGQTRQ